MTHKVMFRDYKHYPPELSRAYHFRDEFDDLPDGAYFGIAEEHGLNGELDRLGQWELENTDFETRFGYK